MVKITFNSKFETIEDFLTDKNKEEVQHIKQIIKPCSCSSQNLILQEYENMGETSYIVKCKTCNKKLQRGQYDYDITKFEDILDFLIRDWNNGTTQEDLDNAKLKEYERIILTMDDLQWCNYYPNNIPGNGIEGIYSLLFKKDEDNKIFCCKWTILYQKEELEPLQTEMNGKIEAYNLFMKRYLDVHGNLYYPEPTDDYILDTNNSDTLNRHDINDPGDFVRSYKTLEEAKLGAIARCGWQKLNKDTILR